VSDLDALASSTAGKVEIESIEEGRDEQVVEHLLKSAVLTAFRERVPLENLRPVVDAFEGSRIVHAGEDVSSSDYVALVSDMKSLREPMLELTGGDESAASVASAVEFVLEGLHLSKRLNKESVGARAQYRGRG
jgi:magnesium chelatase subunit I